MHAEAAAVLPGAAGALAQGEAAEQHRILLLHHLYRRGLRDADGRAAVGEAVVERRAAVAAAGYLVHHIARALAGIDAAEGEVARGAGRRRPELLGDRLCERQ